MVKEYCVFANKLPVSSNIKFFKKDGEIYKFTNLKDALKKTFVKLNEFLDDDNLFVCTVRESNELERSVELRVTFTRKELALMYARDFATLRA